VITDCEITRIKISEEVDGDLPEVERPALEEHLQSCPDCRAFRREMIDVTRRFVATFRSEAPTPDLTALVMARVRELPPPAPVLVTGLSRPLLGLKAWVTMAAAAVILIVPFLLLRPGSAPAAVVVSGLPNVLLRATAGEWLFAGAGELRAGEEALVLPGGGLRLELPGLGILDAGPGTHFRVEEDGVRLEEGVLAVSVARSSVRVSTAGVQTRFREGRGSVEFENRDGRSLSTVRMEQGHATVANASESASAGRRGTSVAAGFMVRHYGDASKPAPLRDTGAPLTIDLTARSPITGDAEAPALPRLKALLVEGGGPERSAAAEMLGRIGGPMAIAALRGLIFAPDRRADVMVSVLGALRRLGEEVPVDRLRGLLEDESPELQREAVIMISASSDPRAPEILARVIAARERDPTVRRQAGEALVAKGDKQVETLSHTREEESRSRLALVRTIEAEAGTGGAPLIQRFLGDPNPRVRIAAVRALSVLDDPSAAGRLRDRWAEEEDDDVRSELLCAYALLDGEPDRVLLGRLLADDTQDNLRRHAADALALRHGSDWAAEQLRRVLRDPSSEAFQRKAALAYAQVVGDASHETLRELLVPTMPADVRAGILEKLGSRSRFPLDLVLETLRDEADPTVWKAAARLLTDERRKRTWTEADRRLIWTTVSGLIDRTELERRQWLFWALPLPVDAADEARLLAWAQDETQINHLLPLLAQCGGAPREYLVARLNQGRTQDRDPTLGALAPGARPEEAAAFRQFFEAAQRLEGRTALLAAAALARSGDRSQVPFIRLALHEPDFSINRHALLAAGVVGGSDLFEDVRELLESPDSSVRSKVVRALLEIGDPRAVTDLGRLAADTQDNYILRLRAALTCAALQPELPPTQLKALLQEGPDGLPPGQDLELLDRLGERTWGQLNRRLSRVMNGRDPLIRQLATFANPLEPSNARIAGWLQLRVSELVRAHRSRVEALYREREERLQGLVSDLKKGSLAQRLRAARELAEVFDRATIRDLMDALEDPDPAVRAEAKQSLAQILGRGDLEFSPHAGAETRERQLRSLRERWEQNEGTTKLRVPEYVEVHQLLESRPK